ncbi:MAG: sigma-54 dependent transcriptional regulator [Spirochaetaceae bacterium]|jgi:two-component system nitrogen regulation response regulator NtrX|nr:sigma-54 dependent transcriptional regulator [Spirochaetaceae bacterium]
MTKILIIDDEPGIRRTLASIMEDESYTVFTAEDAVLGLEILESEPIDLVFLDVMLPKMGGMEALERIREGWPGLEVVVISGHANVDMAVRAVKLGAFDFLEKPLSLDKVLTLCRNVFTLQKLREENRALKKNQSKDEIIGLSPQIEGVRALIKQAAQSDARILIFGENGTGKELTARAIHYGSARADKAFVEVNCAAIPDTLIESELFGHEKGAFTDAVSSRKGRFELAHGGTLFLDEIGDMSLSAQAKMLRAIQEQKIQRVGGEKTITVDVRVIAATNKNLEAECKEGRFRQDLFFRLNVIPMTMPALRERKDDIPVLLFHFLKELSGAPYELTGDARDALLSYTWPGNIRELKNLAERIAVMWDDEHISIKAVRELLRWNPEEAPPPSDSAEGPFLSGDQGPFPSNILHLKYNEAKEMFEKYYLEFQLSQNNGIISRAAEAIGIYPSNLHVKLRKYNIVRTER